ncbi:hypothetical protein ABPG73_010119 [Tetrahymena malaccensis]
MIEKFLFFLVIFLLENNNIVRGLEVVYYQDFTNSLSCSNLYSQYWSIVSGSFSGSCQYKCTRSDNGNDAYILSPDMSNFSNGSQMIKSIQKPYSFFGVDLVYLRKDDPLTMSIYDGNTQLFSQDYYGASTGTNIEYNYNLECSIFSGQMQVTKEVVQLNQSLTSNSIRVRILQHVTNDFSWYGVLKLRAWANCVENCDVCLDNTNCSSCLQGFDRYTLPSGQKVCDQTYNCNISNCFSCIKSSPSSATATCVKCLPGYSLDANSNCIANSGGACSSNKYQSGSGCQTYSTQCYIQKQNTYYTWQICSNQVNLSQYKCLNSQSILIYEHKNYSLYTCGCPVNNCIQCPNPSQCSQCQLGFTYDPVQQKCTFVTCPVLYSRDPQTGLCNKNCSGADCQQCDQNQQCTQCNPSGNYYIVTANPTNCAICTVQHCSQCSGEGLCQQCQSNFTLSPDRSTCIPCNVNNCGQCLANQPNICSTCLPGYIQSQDNTTCSCSVQNCSVCNSQNGTICDLCANGYLISQDKKSCSCVAPNCSQCTPSNGSKCQTCVTGEYHLNPDGQTVQCKLNCSLDNCKECQDPPNNKTQCKICNSGYVLDPSTNQCVSEKCQVLQCNQCQPYKPNLCQVCNDQYNLDSNSQCALSTKNDFYVQQTVIQNVGYNVTLVFQNQIVTNDKNFDSQLNIKIEDYVNPFQVSILQVQDKSVKIQLKLQDNCKNKNLVVQMNDPSFVQINNLVDPQKEVKLNEYVILSESQIQQSQQTKQVASGTSSSLLIMVILMIVIGNTYVLFSTIDLTTFIYFMLFIDVRYPDNVMSFCSIFQNFQFAFIPNAIQVYMMDPNYTQPQTPKKFIDNGYDAYFFNGAGQSLTTMAGIMAIYGIIKILSYIPITSVKVYIRSKIKSGWEYCGFFDMVGCVYVYLLISSLLQFYSFQFDESLAFINYTLFSLTFVFTIIYPIMITIFIKKCKNLNDPQIQLQFGSIIGGLVLPENDQSPEEQNKHQQNSLNESNQKIQNESKSEQKIEHIQLTRQKQLQYKWSRYTNVILYARKIIYMMVLLYFYGEVYLQMIIINSMNIFLSIFYLYVKPQEEKSANIKNGISEVLLVIMQVTICFLVKDDDSQREQDRFNIGWIIVGSASLILTIHIFSVVVDLLKGIYNLVKDFICTLIKPKAEIEKLKQEKLAEEQNKQNKFLRLASQISIDKLRSMKKKLSLIPQSQLDISITSIQRHQIKSKSIIIQPKNNENNQFLEPKKQLQNLDQSNKNYHKDEENQIQRNENKNSSYEQKNSPDHEKINLQNSFIHNNINNQTTHRILFSAPQSINISNNDLLASKNPSQVFL